MGRREAAVLCVLLLRGPQTTGELRGRTERLYRIRRSGRSEATLRRLAEDGFVRQLARQAGFKEPRWSHLLSGEPAEGAEEPAAETVHSRPLAERVAQLEAELADLRSQFEDFRRRFE
ncbi:MAG TPA: DUF480 domain-containing protein [Bryobacteraceae bacterium]|nr:DUF480 domain-containing protein [Bryobacteraceae bacterium]